MSSTVAPAHLRSLYRSFLRELPSRRLTASPVQKRIRTAFASPPSGSAQQVAIDHAQQYLQYLKAQRMYATLLERYNPGMNMDEEERVKLTARRVGFELPEEYVVGKE
jgi:ATP synthase assembly factor FMC1, mitochondrial